VARKWRREGGAVISPHRRRAIQRENSLRFGSFIQVSAVVRSCTQQTKITAQYGVEYVGANPFAVPVRVAKENTMTRSIALGMIGAAAAFMVSLAFSPDAARAADDKIFLMKITLPTLNDSTHQFAKNYAAALEKDSGGRIKTELYPASQLGSIPRQIEGTQFGAIECAVLPPEFFVGIDGRFEVMAAPGLVDSMEHGQRLAADPAVVKLILGLGADKGLRGVGLMMASPSSLITRTPVRHLADLKGKKIRVLASQFQTEALERLGANPVALTLGDVLPALQQGAIDGALSALKNFVAMHFADTSKSVTEIGQPAIFAVVEISRKWYDTLPADLQQIVASDAAAQSVAVNPQAIEILDGARKDWVGNGGELIHLPPDEQSSMLETLASVGEDVSKAKPQLSAAYQVVTEAAQRTRQPRTP
jgi:TRAP-type C4-dicarboxylate transport system substrate-binding protein